MKIGFNTLNSGLANNGGSRTVISCAQAIENLGHQCELIATTDKFDWFPHKKAIPYIPDDLDVIVATACTTVPSTLESRIKKKAWYIRGHEIWMWSETQLIECYNSGLFNITNSNGLKRKLESYGAEAVVVHQGIDFDLWDDLKLRNERDKIRIGCLFNKKPTKRWIDFIRLAEELGTKDYEYVGIGDQEIKADFLTEYTYNVPSSKLKEVYSSCHIWFAPTELEGLHNVPMEAALCGCLILCSSAPMNGMCMDYAFDRDTAMVYKPRNIKEAADLVRYAEWDHVDDMKDFLVNDIGSREKNMKKFMGVLKEM